MRDLAFMMVLAAMMLLNSVARGERGDAVRVYVNQGGAEPGVLLFDLDTATGKLTPRGHAVRGPRLAFMDVDPTGRYLYATSGGDRSARTSGRVHAFRIDADTGALTPLAPLDGYLTHGSTPAYVHVAPDGRHVLVANFRWGSVVSYPIRDDGGLDAATGFIQHDGASVHPTRQTEPHPHAVRIGPSGRYAYSPDLGADRVFIHRYDPGTGQLTPGEPRFASTTSGAGPRHLDFHPSGRFAYVINEMTSSVTAFAVDADTGGLTEMQTITTLPPDHRGGSCAEVRVHPSGRFLYGSNRGHDSIAVFTIDADTGRLTAVEHEPTGGKTPRHFTLDRTGRFLLAANQGSSTLVVFRIDPLTGALEPTGQSVAVDGPSCVAAAAPSTNPSRQ